MAGKIKYLILPIIILFSACELFLGPEPDTSPSEVLKSLWNDFNNLHANLEIRMKDNEHNYNSWYDVYHNKQTGYALKIYPNMTEDDLFYMCGDMLKELNDPHVKLMANGKTVNSFTPPPPPLPYDWFSSAIVRSQLKEYGDMKQTNFLYGVFWKTPEIGYIWINSFTSNKTDDHEWGRKIDEIIDSLANTKALVLDVRENGGGDGNVMEFIASRFASEHKDYMKSRMKTGPGQNDFSSPRIYTVKSISKASDNKYGYTKPIALLTNVNTVSAAEWFTMALKTQSHVKHIGTKTCGAFSARLERSMINGWNYSISPERVTDMNDEPVEGIGIIPDETIQNTPPGPSDPTEDKQLERAIEYLKKYLKEKSE